MSDYLTRLAARALGQAEVVQPRLPSLFEAVPPAGLDEHVVRDAPPSDVEPHRSPHDMTAHRRIEESERQGDESEHRARVASRARPAVDDLPRSPVEAAARAVDSAPATARARDDAAPAARGRQAPKYDAERDVEHPQSAPGPREREQADARQQAAPARKRQDAARERREPEVAPRMAGSRPAVVVERPARGDAPSVRVTIGRVEVRAIAPPPPRPALARPRSPVPRLSLDEYVRLRDEGKR